MPNILVRDVPDTVHARLQSRAAQRGISLQRLLVEALEQVGTEEQKAKYLTKLVSGEWTGAMVLAEPGARMV